MITHTFSAHEVAKILACHAAIKHGEFSIKSVDYKMTTVHEDFENGSPLKEVIMELDSVDVDSETPSESLRDAYGG